jgi:hypothetical protein
MSRESRRQVTRIPGYDGSELTRVFEEDVDGEIREMRIRICRSGPRPTGERGQHE